MIKTGLRKIDNFLSGGIPNGLIVDIFGGSGTGKTQLLLQLSINSIKNGGNVLYLDTTGGFRPERILEIQKKSNMDFNLLDKITVSRVTNTSEQINSIKNLHTNNFSLIVIDNITDLFSYEYNND
jgi:DNA repair protein RAD51